MTRKIFWDNPYLASHESRISRTEGPEVFLDSTIFFAFSGGQESDRGSIGGIPVVKAEVRECEISYTLPEDHGLSAGDTIEVTIDWERRYRLMRLHFAAELVLETVNRMFPGIKKIGAHISEEKARLDFLLGESLTLYLARIAENVSRLIQQNLSITSAYENEETERRYWKVDGFARVPCGGTHLRRTGEIGAIELKRNNIGKGKERIEIKLKD